VWNGVTSSGPLTGSGGFEQIDTIGHNLKLLGSGDQGGPFILHRELVTCGYGIAKTGQGKGSQVAFHPDARAFAKASEPDTTAMWGLGGTAIARCAPDQTSFDVPDFLAQTYVGGIPKAFGVQALRAKAWEIRNLYRAGKSAKSLAGEYLNVEFGWLPLVHDVLNFCRTVSDSQKVLQDLTDGSGHKTRTGYRFPVQTSTSTSDRGPFVYSLEGSKSGWSTGGKFSSTTVSETTTWFKGCFTYTIPKPSTMSTLDRYKSFADHVLGLGPRINPEVMWDAAPWSWAVDWAVNVGDVAHNIALFSRDSLHMQYGYIMTHASAVTDWQFYGTTVTPPLSARGVSEWKKRFPASPYGFGLTYDGLSSTQKAILAAVGITHF
jgi:hypothetical protein